MYSSLQFARILLSIFASMFMREIGLKLGINLTVASYNELNNVPSASILWNSVGRVLALGLLRKSDRSLH